MLSERAVFVQRGQSESPAFKRKPELSFDQKAGYFRSNSFSLLDYW